MKLKHPPCRDVLGIDPGDRSPALFYLRTNNPCQFSQDPILYVPTHVPVFIEGQFPRPKSSRQSLMTLSFHAGLQAGHYLAQGNPVYALQPRAWREELQRGSGTMPKTVFHNRMRAAERIPDEVWHECGDVVDAYLIATAGALMLEKNKKLTKVKWRI